MTPQAFSYATVASNGMIYCPPYGLNECLDYMIKINPDTYEVSKIPLTVDDSFEKYQYGTVVGDYIVWLPYNESKIIILDTRDDSIEYTPLSITGKGKFIKAHLYYSKIIALPYGENDEFNYIISFDIDTREVSYNYIQCPINDEKKWHTSQLLNGKIYAVPRGERWDGDYFPYRIEVDCNTLQYELFDMSDLWSDYDMEQLTNKKYTTMALANNKLYAPPYSENSNFDVMLKFDGLSWTSIRTGYKNTSRKWFSNNVASNGKIYFPPAGHEEDWSEMLVIDSNTDEYKTIDLGLGKESKKYFTGCESSMGKLYYIPRGGCVCMPPEEWKLYGDLAEILVVDTLTDLCYTIDVSDYFTDSTTIEKYNCAVIVNDKIFAMPYGQSDSFQNVLVFDTVTETVVKEIDLNGI